MGMQYNWKKLSKVQKIFLVVLVVLLSVGLLLPSFLTVFYYI